MTKLARRDFLRECREYANESELKKAVFNMVRKHCEGQTKSPLTPEGMDSVIKGFFRQRICFDVLKNSETVDKFFERYKFYLNDTMVAILNGSETPISEFFGEEWDAEDVLIVDYKNRFLIVRFVIQRICSSLWGICERFIEAEKENN